MSCYNCAKSFSLLNKERGCANCGFSFCSGCLKCKAAVRGSNKKEANVCAACYALLTNPSRASVRPPPDALLRRLETLEHFSPPSDPITVYKKNQDSKLNKLKRGMSAEDKAIAERLEKLQQDRKASANIPTEDEMQERLAKLKGNWNSFTTSAAGADDRNIFLNTDKRSDEEKTHDLLEQIKREVTIDNNILKPEDDIAFRLARLKGLGSSQLPPHHQRAGKTYATHITAGLIDPGGETASLAGIAESLSEAGTGAAQALVDYSRETSQVRNRKGGDETDLESEIAKEEVDKVVENVLAEEATLNEDMELVGDDTGATMVSCQRRLLRQIDRGIHSVEHEEEGREEEELPWCSICNDDAKLRCIGCDGDLYCRTCLEECHREVDLEGHEFLLYRPRSRQE